VSRAAWGLVLAAVGPLAGQSGLADAAQRTRAAWLAHDAEALLERSPGVILQIPGADPSSALRRQQAAELLARYLRTSVERRVEIATVREVEEGRGYVELQRRYRVAGTQEVRTQRLLLGYRLSRTGWSLVELRVVG